MCEKPQEILMKLGDVLHWLGKYREAKLVRKFVSILNIQAIQDDEQLSGYIQHMIDEKRPPWGGER